MYTYDHYDTSTILSSHGDVVSPELVKAALAAFSNKKSPGPDGLRPEVLQHLPLNVIHVICVIYKASLSMGYTPRAWTESRLVFIPKPGWATYHQASDYRPIVLSNYLLKGLERLCV